MENNNLEKLVQELKAVIPFRETTEVGDIVLVVSEQPQMLLYGLITSIERDSTKKEEWWHISLSFLTVPLQNVVWTLRTAQMTGREIFTMGGEKRFFKAVDIGSKTALEPISKIKEPAKNSNKSGLKRIK
jgi:hypothetical protein